MLEFRTPKLEDINKFKSFFFDEEELSCETNFTNLLIWHSHYNTVYYLDERTLFFRMGKEGSFMFSMPYGDLSYGIELIRQYCKQQNCTPTLWACEGKRYEKFKKIYSGITVEPARDSFEYIYNREDLSTLAGKKYHSKRNHIAKFSKVYSWEYESINESNIAEIQYFADKWYDGVEDEGLISEKSALKLLLNNRNLLNVKGGMIRVDGRIVAFTLGTPINSTTFDIHYEKADKEFLTAYSVINREFAFRELDGYKYINREDDLGIEGLRKAKLSYKPEILLEKYIISFKGE